jgi:hypothetical protein
MPIPIQHGCHGRCRNHQARDERVMRPFGLIVQPDFRVKALCSRIQQFHTFKRIISEHYLGHPGRYPLSGNITIWTNIE